MTKIVLSRRSTLVAGVTSLAAVLGFGARAADESPFSVHARPSPSGTDLAVLLPANVGAFVRDRLPDGAVLSSDEDLNVDYRAGGDTVSFGLSRPESVDDAREAIKVTRDEALASKAPMRDAKYSTTTDPAYFHAGDFVAWTRGNYFFYAKANSATALARFMAEFPF